MIRRKTRLRKENAELKEKLLQKEEDIDALSRHISFLHDMEHKYYGLVSKLAHVEVLEERLEKLRGVMMVEEFTDHKTVKAIMAIYKDAVENYNQAVMSGRRVIEEEKAND